MFSYRRVKIVPSILIAEDDEMLREGFKLILSSQPYEINFAMDGEQALQLCKQTTFDLILLDLMMPKLDGIEFIKKYSAMKLPKTKIIVMSNLSSNDKATAVDGQ
jgi:CheY-like chemotaxis protein